MKKLLSELKSLPLIFFLLFTSSAHAVVYAWIDSTGVAHYTNREYEIPARYKSKAKALYPEATDSSRIPLSIPNEQAKPDVQQAPIAVQQVKPAEQQPVQPLVATPKQKDSVPTAPAKRGRRQRGSTNEE